MYIFEAKYQNMENGNERKGTIMLHDGRTEDETYVEAMRRAIQMKESFESNFQDINTINNFFTLYFDNLIGLCLNKFPEIEDTSIIRDIVNDYLSKLPNNIYIENIIESLEEALYEYTF